MEFDEKQLRFYKLFLIKKYMMPGSKGQNAVHVYMIRHLNSGPAKHEKEAIYVVNQRISNV